MLGIENIDIVVVTGLAVSVATQILKSQFLSFLPAERYPRLTAIGTSLVASPVALHLSGAELPGEVSGWIAMVAAVVLVAVGTYHGLLKKTDRFKGIR